MIADPTKMGKGVTLYGRVVNSHSPNLLAKETYGVQFGLLGSCAQDGGGLLSPPELLVAAG